VKRGVLLLVPALAWGAEKAPSDKLADYLVDIGAGPVSAADLIGVAGTGVTQVQSLKDFNVLFQPGAGGDQKAGYGLELTPLRTRWSPVGIAQYRADPWTRFLASTSVSYARNTASYAGATHVQQAAAIHATYFWKPADDPVVAAHMAFDTCDTALGIEKQKAAELQRRLQERAARTPPITNDDRDRITREYLDSASFQKLATDADEAVQKCVAGAAKAAWNAPVIAATLGAADIQPEAGGARLALTRSLSLSAVFPAGANGAVNLTVRRSQKDLDLKSIGTRPTFGRTTLVGGRYTYRGNENSDLFGVLEVSDTHGVQDGIASTAFKYALGIDKKVGDLVWIEFRLGRARSITSGKDEPKALLNLKWSSTPSLPTLWTKQ